MEERMGLLFLILLGAIWACHASELANAEPNKKSDVCALCEECTTEALDYLNDNMTQNKIINVLHNTCSQLLSFNNQCTKLVDYYVPLFFLEIASIQPGELCKMVHLCPYIPKMSSQVQENSCDMCRSTVSAILVKLKDPDTQIEIMRALLKACNNMEDLKEKCKRVVFKYGPWAIVNAEKFLKITDICTELHVCQATSVGSHEASMIEGIPLLSDTQIKYWEKSSTRIYEALIH